MSDTDPRFFALKDALRAAITMPTAFALALVVFDSQQMALFASFGAMAMLVFVDFGGPWRVRLRAYLLLALAGGLLVALGTVCSRTEWLATVVMALVAFGIIFSGVLNGYVAAAQSGAILAFVLAVMVPADVSEIPARLAGWGLAAGLSTAAVLGLWPRRPRSVVRWEAAAAARSLADLVETAASGRGGEVAEARAAARQSILDLRHTFVSLPDRPSGNGGRTAALARVIDDLGWLLPFAAIPGVAGEDGSSVPFDGAEVEAAAPELLREVAARLEGGSELPDSSRVQRANRAVGQAVLDRFEQPDGDVVGAAAALDEAFRLRQLAFGTLHLADDTLSACGGVAGGEPASRRARIEETRRLARAQASPGSVWLHNSLRGAAGLALAVLVAQLTDLQHGFWVVLGTLSVLRSNALSTETSVVSALAGTFAGIVVGGLFVELVGTQPALLWPALPFAVLLAGYAPKAISFAAGQAAFSVVVLLLFNLIDPVGWQVGLVRVEDVAVGAGVSVLAGLLLWPHGATAALRRAVGSAYKDSAIHLAATIRSLLGARVRADEAAAASFASAQLLDTAVRGYLSEQSSARGGMEEMPLLIAGATRLRRMARLFQSAHMLGRLAPVDEGLPRVAEARDALEAEVRGRSGWYEALGNAIARTAPMPKPEGGDPPAPGLILDRSEDGIPPGVAIAWAHRHLQVLLELEPMMAAAGASLRR